MRSTIWYGELDINIEDIKKEWDKDCLISNTDLGNESLNIGRLHNKYIKELFSARIEFEDVNIKYDELYKLKTDYFLGRLTKEKLEELKWEINHHKYLKVDLDIILKSDRNLNEIRRIVILKSEKIKFLEEIIKQIHNRNYQIKNKIDWEKFMSGA